MDTDYPWISIESNIVTCPDAHRVKLHAYSMTPELAPQIVVLGGLLSEAECDELVALSRERMQTARSSSAAPARGTLGQSGAADEARLASNEGAVVAKIEARIAALTQWSIDDADDLEVTLYREGGVFMPRHDASDTARSASWEGPAPRARIATVIMYLNDCPSSGAISFPRTGLSVCPHKGNALFFNYPNMGGNAPDGRCLHGGLPIPAGEKWIATKWLTRRSN